MLKDIEALGEGRFEDIKHPLRVLRKRYPKKFENAIR